MLEGKKVAPALLIITTGAVIAATYKYGAAKYTNKFKSINEIKSGLCWGASCSIPVACAALIGSEESCLKFSNLDCALLSIILCATLYRFQTFIKQAESYIPGYTTEEMTDGYANGDERYADQLPNTACIFSSIFLTVSIIGLRLYQNYF